MDHNGPVPYSNSSQTPDPPYFSLPTTFKLSISLTKLSAAYSPKKFKRQYFFILVPNSPIFKGFVGKKSRKSKRSKISHLGTVKSLLLHYCTQSCSHLSTETLWRIPLFPLPFTPSRKRNEE
jgi:hypothetical protein